MSLNFTERQLEIMNRIDKEQIFFLGNNIVNNGKILNNVENKPYFTLLKSNILIYDKNGKIGLNRKTSKTVKDFYIKKYKKLPTGMYIKKLPIEKMRKYVSDTFYETKVDDYDCIYSEKDPELDKFQYLNIDYLNLDITGSYFICLFNKKKLIGYINLEHFRDYGYNYYLNNHVIWCISTLDIHKDFQGKGYSKILLANLNNYLNSSPFVYTNVSRTGRTRNVGDNLELLLYSKGFSTNKIPQELKVKFKKVPIKD